MKISQKSINNFFPCRAEALIRKKLALSEKIYRTCWWARLLCMSCKLVKVKGKLHGWSMMSNKGNDSWKTGTFPCHWAFVCESLFENNVLGFESMINWFHIQIFLDFSFKLCTGFQKVPAYMQIWSASAQSVVLTHRYMMPARTDLRMYSGNDYYCLFTAKSFWVWIWPEVCLRVHSGCFGFLPQSKDTQVRLTDDSNLSAGINVCGSFLSLRISPVMTWQPIQGLPCCSQLQDPAKDKHLQITHIWMDGWMDG